MARFWPHVDRDLCGILGWHPARVGGATTIALMLPFIYDMTPVGAFAFLFGMLSVTATTGDITSVLFGVPGESVCAATILDGHPMAKRGKLEGLWGQSFLALWWEQCLVP